MHAALLVCVREGRVIDVLVAMGPNFGIGEFDAQSERGVRLLLAEVRTTHFELTDRAIWYAVRTFRDMCLVNGHRVVEWVLAFEEREVLAKRMSLDETLLFGR